MQDIFGSVRRSVVFRPNPAGPEIGAGDGGGGGSGSRIVEKIGSCLRKSMVGIGLGLGGVSPKLLSSPPLPSPAEEEEDDSPPIRWRKGELIGCGAFGHVYMGMNLDSGELFAVKQVLIAKNTGSKERAQAHIRELEEEVKLLKNLSHPNIVRYIGTAREEESLNILLEFVPGGSISSLLGKFGSFPEAVIRMYTKQLLQGLEYLHQNGIIHRDIKGANILVDNKGCIRLADFGASKQVAKLATMTAAKSMKGTPYWMAPEVILQTGHSFSADIWSVGCTVIEMATGKPPWSQQYQEVAALFHIGSTKSHPPIPEHLSLEAKDFLSKCLQKEPSLRPTASDLLQHPFVRREFKDPHPMYRSSVMERSEKVFSSLKPYTKNSVNPVISRSRPVWDVNINDEMCRLDDNFDNPPLVGSSFNPVAEPVDEWPCHFLDTSLEQRGTDSAKNGATSSGVEGDSDFRFPCELVCEGDEDDEVTETKIRAFLDEKALDLKKLQTPLYEEFFNSLNTTSEPCVVANSCEDVVTDNLVLPSNSSRSSSPSKAARGVSSAKQEVDNGNCCSPVRKSGMESNRILREIPSPLVSEWGGLLQDAQQEYNTISSSSSERRRKWKEELDRELEKEREKMMCRAVGVKTSPKDSGKGIGAAALLNRKVILDQRFRSSIAHDRQKK